MEILKQAIPQLHDILESAAQRLPDKIALVIKGERVTYRELDARANALAASLIAGGVARGDRVIVFADNTLETVVSFWGVLKAHAVVSIVNPQTKADKLAYYLNDCRATALISDAHLTPIFVEAAAAGKSTDWPVHEGEDASAEAAAAGAAWRETAASIPWVLDKSTDWPVSDREGERTPQSPGSTGATSGAEQCD